jgi:hypothetical protein
MKPKPTSSMASARVESPAFPARHAFALPAFALLALAGIVISGCTFSRSSERFYYARSADTLLVRLSSTGQSHWDPAKDSLIIDCSNCDPGSAHMVERFEDHSGAVFQIDPEANLQLRMSYMGQLDTVNLPGLADTLLASPYSGHRVPHRPRRTATTASEPPTPPKKPVEKPIEKPAPVPDKPAAPHVAHSVKVTAAEGVAVYKDKSKTEVLKIVPEGTNLPLLAREGDLISVSIDGQEGFVEAEAVHVNE